MTCTPLAWAAAITRPTTAGWRWYSTSTRSAVPDSATATLRSPYASSPIVAWPPSAAVRQVNSTGVPASWSARARPQARTLAVSVRASKKSARHSTISAQAQRKRGGLGPELGGAGAGEGHHDLGHAAADRDALDHDRLDLADFFGHDMLLGDDLPSTLARAAFPLAGGFGHDMLPGDDLPSTLARAAFPLAGGFGHDMLPGDDLSSTLARAAFPLAGGAVGIVTRYSAERPARMTNA